MIVAPIPINSGLTNQNTHYAYEDGSIHIVLRQHASGKRRGIWEKRYHHYWRNSDGVWKKEVLPFVGTRPKLVGTRNKTLVLVYASNEQLLIAKGTPRPNVEGWDWCRVELSEPESIIGDALLDLQRWESEQVLSVYSQAEPARLLETNLDEPIDGFPSPLHVIDYQRVEIKE